MHKVLLVSVHMLKQLQMVHMTLDALASSKATAAQLPVSCWKATLANPSTQNLLLPIAGPEPCSEELELLTTKEALVLAPEQTMVVVVSMMVVVVAVVPVVVVMAMVSMVVIALHLLHLVVNHVHVRGWVAMAAMHCRSNRGGRTKEAWWSYQFALRSAAGEQASTSCSASCT